VSLPGNDGAVPKCDLARGCFTPILCATIEKCGGRCNIELEAEAVADPEIASLLKMAAAANVPLSGAVGAGRRDAISPAGVDGPGAVGNAARPDDGATRANGGVALPAAGLAGAGKKTQRLADWWRAHDDHRRSVGAVPTAVGDGSVMAAICADDAEVASARIDRIRLTLRAAGVCDCAACVAFAVVYEADVVALVAPAINGRRHPGHGPAAEKPKTHDHRKETRHVPSVAPATRGKK
jgi:hypothetical protein